MRSGGPRHKRNLDDEVEAVGLSLSKTQKPAPENDRPIALKMPKSGLIGKVMHRVGRGYRGQERRSFRRQSECKDREEASLPDGHSRRYGPETGADLEIMEEIQECEPVRTMRKRKLNEKPAIKRLIRERSLLASKTKTRHVGYSVDEWLRRFSAKENSWRRSENEDQFRVGTGQFICSRIDARNGGRASSARA